MLKNPAVLLEIAVASAKGVPIEVLKTASVTCESGIDGDYRGRFPTRQVTVVAREAWELACADLGSHVPWTVRRANLLVQGVDLEETAGSVLRVGDVLLEVDRETTPCDLMDEARDGLRAALDKGWRGGVTCRVIEAGRLQVGDPISLQAPSPGSGD